MCVTDTKAKLKLFQKYLRVKSVKNEKLIINYRDIVFINILSRKVQASQRCQNI